MVKKSKKKSIKKERQNKFFVVAPIVIIMLAILCRIFYAINATAITQDEFLFSQDVFNRDFWGLFNPLSSLQIAPPLFSCLVKLVAVKDIHLTLKIIPVLTGCASVLAFYYLLKNLIVNKIVILLGLILFAFNPALINASCTLKPYSTDILIAICLLIYFVKYNPEGYWRQFIQILLLSVSMLFSLPAFFTMVGGITSILQRDYRKFFYALTAFTMFVLFYFVYHLWNVMETHGAALDSYWRNFFITSANSLSLSLNFIKNNFNPFFNPFVSLCVMSAALLVTIFRDKKFALITAMAFVALVTASYLHLYPLAPELTIFAIPFLIILICESLDLAFVFFKK